MKYGKRILSLFVSLCLVITLLPARAAAATVKSGTCGEELTWTLDESGVLTIRGTGDMVFANSGNAPWYMHCSDINTVIIEDGVANIRDGAFAGCEDLTSIIIPSSVSSIGSWSFDFCVSLTNIIIPASVTSIGFGAFANCESLTSVDIPHGVVSIGGAAFQNCKSLEHVTISDSVIRMDSSFGGCPKLMEVNVDPGNSFYCSVDGVLYSKNMDELICFPAAKNVASYVIPDDVVSIDDEAVSLCSVLTSVSIPDSVTFIGMNAFGGCQSLSEINVSPGNTVFSSKDGVLYSKDMKELIFYPSAKNTAPFIVPSGVTKICDSAFYKSMRLTSVHIPYSVTNIEGFAFADCENLANITFANGVTSIGGWAFSNCKSLTSINIPSSVTRIDDMAFANCESLNSVTFYGSYCFHGDNQFANVTTTCYYPSDNRTWWYVDGSTQHLGGDITWVAYTPPLEPEYIPGDINGDGEVNNKDATRLFQHLSGWTVDVVEAALDVNGDGSVNNKDATRLFQRLSGWDVEIY